jgi:hypothetical protein
LQTRASGGGEKIYNGGILSEVEITAQRESGWKLGGSKFNIYNFQYNADKVDKGTGAFGISMSIQEGIIDMGKRYGDIGKQGNRVLSVTKALGMIAGIPGAVNAWYEFSIDKTSANFIKATANSVMVFGRVNPFVAAGVGIMDVTGVSDCIYNYVGNGIDNTFFNNRR